MRLVSESNYDYVKRFADEWIGLHGFDSSFRYFNAPMEHRLDRLKNHLTTVVVVSEKDEPVGYGHLDEGPDGRVWLGVAVLPEYQRLLIGTQICTYLLEQATEKKLKEIWLGVDEKNIPARRLYRKLGFEVENMQKEFWLMKKVFDKTKFAE